MSLDKIKSFLTNLPLKYKGQTLKFKGLETGNKAYGREVLDIIYEYEVTNLDEPFVIYHLIDDFLNKQIRRYIKHIYKDSQKYKETYWTNSYGIRFCIDLNIDGHIDRIYEFGASNSNNEILIGRELEKVFEETYSGNINTRYGNCEYSISYTKSDMYQSYTMVDDSSLYVRPDVNITDFVFTPDFHIDPPKITEELISNLKNLTEEMVVGDFIPIEIVGHLPYQEPLNVKMSELTKGFLEMLFFHTIEEDDYILDTVSPAHGYVMDGVAPLLYDIDDSYVRPSINNFSVDGVNVKPLSSYYPDDTGDAENTFIMSYAADYILSSGLVDKVDK